MIYPFSKTRLRPLRLSHFIAALALIAPPTVAVGQTYPSQPVRLVVPFDAGGGVNLAARLLVERLNTTLGHQVIVENRPGAGGKIGADSVSRAEPDGYSILFTVGGDLTIWQSKRDAPDRLRNLTPITSAVSTVTVIAARPDLPINSIGELLEFIKRNPGKLSFGGVGIGSHHHLMREYLKGQGIEMLYVPYKGLAPVMTDLAAGHIDLAITNLTTALPLATQGGVKILALARSSRFEVTPDIPAIKETMPSFKLPEPWYGFFGPPNLPNPIVSRLASEIGKVLVEPEMKATLMKSSMVAIVTTPEQFSAMVAETGMIYRSIIESANIQIE